MPNGPKNLGKGHSNRHITASSEWNIESSETPYHDGYGIDARTSSKLRSSGTRPSPPGLSAHHVSGLRPKSTTPTSTAKSVRHSFEATRSYFGTMPSATSRTQKKLAKPLPSPRLSTVPMGRQTRTSAEQSRVQVTSHQRPATSQQLPTVLDTTAEEVHEMPHSEEAHTEVHKSWRRYFNPKAVPHATLLRQRFSREQERIKQIFPDPQYQPTLLLAIAVTPPRTDMDLEDDGLLVARPKTSLGILRPESSPTFGSSRKSHESKHRRSFSFSDMLSAGRSRSKRDYSGRASSNPLAGNDERRITSAPVSTSEGGQAHGAVDGSDRPSKRRDLTDPVIVQKDIYSRSWRETLSDATESDDSRGVLVTLSAFHEPAGHRITTMDHSMPVRHHRESRSEFPTDLFLPPASPSPLEAAVQPSHSSLLLPEHVSTLVGSDSEAFVGTVGDDDDTDMVSEVVYDSLRTRTTRSSSGMRSPRIETIFDEEPPERYNMKLVNSPGDISQEHAVEYFAISDGDVSIVEEDDGVSTPVRPVVLERKNRSSKSTHHSERRTGHATVHPSAPNDPFVLNLGRLEWDNSLDDDDTKWSHHLEADNDWGRKAAQPLSADGGAHQLSAPYFLMPPLKGSASSSTAGTPRRRTADFSEKDTRNTIFDWAEQPPVERSPGNTTPPRPKTVHGKKDPDVRGSRGSGRRAPTAVHARSQSVPVVPDLDGKRSQVVSNKFGTWGLGSKGCTEDWNDDFDFEDSQDLEMNETDDELRVDSGLAMVVPQTIMEQQTIVLANIGLLREWGLVIEELKELRMRAFALGMFDERVPDVWQEADAMIDLADQEAGEISITSQFSRESSPETDSDAFDEGPSLTGAHGTQLRKSLRTSADGGFDSTALPVLREERTPQSTPRNAAAFASRPRKDSEAVARSVIEALQSRRSASDPLSTARSAKPEKKVPFDTATLRHIVPYVKGLTRRIKDSIREIEGLYSSPSRVQQHDDHPLSKIFREPGDGSPKTLRSRPSNTHGGNIAIDENHQATANDIARHMQMMTVM